MQPVVLDTDVVSFWFKGDSRASKYRAHLTGKLLIVSLMTVAEIEEWMVLRKWGQQRRERMERHLQRFLLHPIDRTVCRLWADVRQFARQSGRTVNHADAWIAATALACAAPLVTHNAADYQGVAGLSVFAPP